MTLPWDVLVDDLQRRALAAGIRRLRRRGKDNRFREVVLQRAQREAQRRKIPLVIDKNGVLSYA